MQSIEPQCDIAAERNLNSSFRKYRSETWIAVTRLMYIRAQQSEYISKFP